MIFITGRLNKKLTVRDAVGIIGSFSPAREGDYGYFVTESGELIERIKSTALYKNGEVKEYIGGKPQFDDFVQGSGGYAELSGLLSKMEKTADKPIQNSIPQQAIDVQAYIKFGELKVSLIRKDGTYRRDASEEEIKEYETLKEKLGV